MNGFHDVPQIPRALDIFFLCLSRDHVRFFVPVLLIIRSFANRSRFGQQVLLLIGLSVGGSLVMRKYRTSLAVGFFLGVVVIMSQTMLVLFAVFAGRATTAEDDSEKPADRAFAAFCLFLWIVYTTFAGEMGSATVGGRAGGRGQESSSGWAYKRSKRRWMTMVKKDDALRPARSIVIIWSRILVHFTTCAEHVGISFLDSEECRTVIFRCPRLFGSSVHC